MATSFVWSETRIAERTTGRAHPVKVGSTSENDNGDVCQVHEVYAEYLRTLVGHGHLKTGPLVDPPTASHDTPAGTGSGGAVVRVIPRC